MKYRPPYSIENGCVYEYSEEHRAYLFLYRKSQLSKIEWQSYQRQIATYDAKYDSAKGRSACQ